MTSPARIRELPWQASPLEVAAAWPSDTRLCMVHTGRPHPRWARWSILASPRGTIRLEDDLIWRTAGEVPTTGPASADPLADLDNLLTLTSESVSAADDPPFSGGWMGYLGYEFGRIIEPRATHAREPVGNRPWPLVELAWCPEGFVYDHLQERWYEFGSSPLTERVGAALTYALDDHPPPPEIGGWVSSLSPDDYLSGVGRVLEYIGAGDVFQVNLTQRMSAEFRGSARALTQAALNTGRAWYGAYLEFGEDDADTERRLTSLSPELFLQFEPRNRSLVTRPVKGTRPLVAGAGELLRSGKDTAELNMIVDLMRNDLGRICEFGSVAVPHGRVIETHPTVHHGVGEVTGVVRGDVSFVDVLRATFPGGSVTGAPKIRAMQIIEELEPVPRGPYCGAIGWIGRDGRFALNIAIRTLSMCARRVGGLDDLAGTVDYSVGGGIVADSEPVAEYRESLDKAAVLRLTLESLVSLPRPEHVNSTA